MFAILFQLWKQHKFVIPVSTKGIGVSKSVKRERLCLLHKIITNEAEYHVYNTQTIQGFDCVNIEIERFRLHGGSSKIILQDKIFDESWGAMGGDSFTTLVLRALADLKSYIKDNNEIIIKDEKI